MRRILIIDDDAEIRTALKLVLELEGFEVALASNGETGLAAVDVQQFDLVIADIFMPGMDGLETVRAFRRRQSTVPIIVMSGLTFQRLPRLGALPSPDFLTTALEFGATYALRKPFQPDELMRAIRICLEPGGPAPSPGKTRKAQRPSVPGRSA